MGIMRAIDLALDLYNNIFIVDDIQDMVFKIDTTLKADVFIDNQLGKQKSFSLSDIIFDKEFKNLYLAEEARSRVLKFRIDEQGLPGPVEILFDDTSIADIFNVAIFDDTTLVTVPVSGSKLVTISPCNSAVNSLTGAQHVISARRGGKGFAENSIYLTTATGIVRVEMFLPVRIDENRTAPAEFWLGQNFPNPFNPDTRISYALPRKCSVEIKLFDIMGRCIKTLVSEEQPAGYYEAVWNGLDEKGNQVSSGFYMYTLKTDTFTKTRKLLLLQ